MKLAQEHNLYVIEDNAQAIGADYTWADGRKQKAGAIGHVAANLLFPFQKFRLLWRWWCHFY